MTYAPGATGTECTSGVPFLLFLSALSRPNRTVARIFKDTTEGMGEIFGSVRLSQKHFKRHTADCGSDGRHSDGGQIADSAVPREHDDRPLLVGAREPVQRTSPRPIAPATMPPVPMPQYLPRRPDAFGNPAGRQPRSRPHDDVLSIREGPPESERNGLPWLVLPLRSRPEATPNPTLPEWFPHVWKIVHNQAHSQPTRHCGGAKVGEEGPILACLDTHSHNH